MKGLQAADRREANAYELTKFREEDEREVILSDSLARRWARPFGGQGRRGAHASLKTQPCDSQSKTRNPTRHGLHPQAQPDASGRRYPAPARVAEGY